MSLLRALYIWLFNSSARFLDISLENASPTLNQTLTGSVIVGAAFAGGIFVFVQTGIQVIHLADALVLLTGIGFFLRNGLSWKKWGVFVCVLLLSCVMMWPLATIALAVSLTPFGNSLLITGFYLCSTFVFTAILWCNLWRAQRFL